MIEVQSGLLAEQNTRISEQSLLLAQDVQLAEASRNAALAVEITQIAAALGEAANAANRDLADHAINVLDPATDLDRALILRITSISRALKPYRFLDLGMAPGDDSDRTRVAMQRRRADLGQTYARMAAHFGWAEPLATTALIDRPASPERGQLLAVLLAGGVRGLEVLNAAGLDLSFARMQNADLALVSAQMARLAYGDLSGSYLVECDFGGATLDNARLRQAHISRSRFASLTADRVRPPFRAADAPFTTFASGADFAGAVISASDFGGARLLAANFDGALVTATSFAGADLSAATLRGAVLLGVDLAGAALKSTDLDGAVVFGANALSELAATAAPGSFIADRWVLEPLTLDAVMALPVVGNTLTADEVIAASGGASPFRVGRTQPFE